MSRRICIEPVTRIEGHAKISVQLDDAGRVQSARFHVAEFRGFETFCEGRPFQEMPGLMARVCGICPVSHVLASSKAGDALLGVEIPPAADRQRRLVNFAQLLQSHALSFFHLSSPDLLMGMDAPPEERNIFAMADRDRDFLRRGIRLRQFGQSIIEWIGGKRIHPGWSGPGGVQRAFTATERDQIRNAIPEALATIEIALERLKSWIDRYRPELESMGNFHSLFMGTVNSEGGLEYYDGQLRIVDGAGNIIAADLDPRRYFTFLGESSEDYSYMKNAYYMPFGYPHGYYRVGPLARLNVARTAGTARAEKELREFKQRGQCAVCESFHYHLARLIEMLHAVERIEELIDDPFILSQHTMAKAQVNRTEGVGSCEAPRGTLFHHYFIDEDGLMQKANLLIATSQNHQAMNLAVEQTARRFLKEGDTVPSEGALNRIEAAIRCFDPCLSCSTHAIGQMPLVVDVMRADGSLARRIARAG